MTLCNMSIEAGARAGMIAPDETTFAYLKGRRFVPTGEAWEKALGYWQNVFRVTTMPCSIESLRSMRRGSNRL